MTTRRDSTSISSSASATKATQSRRLKASAMARAKSMFSWPIAFQYLSIGKTARPHVLRRVLPRPGRSRDSPNSIFVRFLKFGALAWGGPAAQIAMIKHECVDEERWVSEEAFKKTLAVFQVLPGPEAHELCVYFGRVRGGRLGGFVAGLGFMLPGLLLMLALSVLYVEADLADHLDELFYGLKAAVGAIVARALVRLSRSFITDVPLALLAAAAFALTVVASASFALLLLGAGIAYELWTSGRRWTQQTHAFSLAPVALLAVATGALTLSLTAEIFWEGLKAAS